MNNGILYFNQIKPWSKIDGKQSYSIPFLLTENGLISRVMDLELAAASILLERGYQFEYMMWKPNHVVVTKL
jgi:hypothetical protein